MQTGNLNFWQTLMFNGVNVSTYFARRRQRGIPDWFLKSSLTTFGAIVIPVT